MQYELTTPCTAADLAPLKAGDTVLLSGVVYTARDQAHKRMLEALDKGEKLPFDLEGSAIYYVGPTPERPGEVIGSAGPTTSGRMDAMSPRLLDLGNKIMIGKGKRDAAVKEAVVRNGAVYLAALGGAGALMAQSVKTLEVIAWPDLGCEAVRRLTVEKLPFDLEGSAIYYVGPTPERPGEVIGSAGPTTSGRMDAMSPRLLDLGNKIMIGKGKRDAAVKEAVVRNGAVYLAALGGAGALMAQSVKTLEVIAWPDLGCEAVRRLTVEKMPLTVILDAHGGDLYTSGPAAYLETVK